MKNYNALREGCLQIMFAYEDFYNDNDGRFEGVEDAKIVGITPLFNDQTTV